MKRIQTVLGDISPEKLGTTMMHEHLFWNQNVYQREVEPGSEEAKFFYSKITTENMYKIRQYNLHNHKENAYQDNVDEAIEEVLLLKQAGGNTLVDCSCLGISRNPQGEVEVSKKTGVNVIMSTGIYVDGSCTEATSLSLSEKAELFIKELTEGVDNTGIKAGVIGEIGINDGFSKCNQESLAAAAIAQKETGAAILIHQPGIWKIGHYFLDILEDNGACMEKVVLCHCDPICDDIRYLERLLARGVNLSFDQFGLEAQLSDGNGRGFWLPRDIDRVRAIARLCELGYSKQLVLSQDLCFKTCYVKYGGGGYAHVINDILPIMRGENIYETAIRNMLVSNPARILAMP